METTGYGTEKISRQADDSDGS